MLASALHSLHRLDQTRLFSFGNVARRMVIKRRLTIRQSVLGTAVFRQSLLPDALDERGFFRSQRRSTSLVASHEHLPLSFGPRGTDAAGAFLIEVAGRTACSRSLLTPADVLDFAGAA